jgi:cyclophilin family peptidyl-prolyl cis-trans isomerase
MPVHTSSQPGSSTGRNFVAKVSPTLEVSGKYATAFRSTVSAVIGRWLLGAVLISFAGIGNTICLAQETAAEPKVVEAGSLPAAEKAMRDHLKKLAQTITYFRLSEDDQKDEELKEEWRQLLIEGRAIAKELQHQVVLDARNATGKEKEDKSRLVYELFATNSDLDRYENNWELAQYLIDIGYEDEQKEIYAMIGRNALALNDFAMAKKYYEKAAQVQVFPEMEQRVGVSVIEAEKKWPIEVEARKKDAEKGDLPRIEFETTKGKFVIEMFEDEAPNAVANIIHLVEKGFYTDMLFHRVEKHVVVQTGCPNGDGTGDAGYMIKGDHANPNTRPHFRGSVGLALAGSDPETGGSQFYICRVPLNHLDGRFIIFGRIIEGMDTVEHLNEAVSSDKKESEEPKLVPDRILNAKVLRKRNHDYVPEYSRPPKSEN